MLDYIKVEDVPSRYDDIIDAIGIDSFLGLVQLYGGSVLYFPTVNSLVKSYRNRVIREDFRSNFNETARKYGLSRSQVYNIINESFDN